MSTNCAEPVRCCIKKCSAPCFLDYFVCFTHFVEYVKDQRVLDAIAETYRLHSEAPGSGQEVSRHVCVVDRRSDQP